MLTAFKEGTAGMNETTIVAILVAAIGALIKIMAALPDC